MIRKILLPTIFAALAYGFWLSPDFKEIAAGVAIFLFGMLSLEEGFRAFTGGLLERLLRNTTDRLWKSLSFGAITTSLMQSSTLVSIITISFLSAGLISLTAGVGIIFGANLGSTTGAWLVAGFGLKVNISAYAMPMIVFGVILIFQKTKEVKGIGYVLTGLGLLFLGIHYMKEGVDALTGSIDLTAYALTGYPGILLFTLIGLVATAIMQSSHATLVLIITALAAHQVTYENALALAIGANIGTTITAILGSLSANVEGKRLAGAHLIFNLVTAGVAILLISQLTQAVDYVSQWLGIANDNYTLKLAVFHSLFNTLGILLMLPFINPMVNFLESLIKPIEKTAAEPMFLNDAATELADTAIEAVRKETLHLYDNAFAIIAGGLSLKPDDILSSRSLDQVIAHSRETLQIDIDTRYNDTVKGLYGSIVAFISHTRSKMTAEQVDELFALRTAGKHIVEAIKGTKHLQKNLGCSVTSDNQYVRKEYDNIRQQLAAVLRELSEIRQHGDDSIAVLSLDSLKLGMKENDVLLTGELDKLIRKSLISPPLATSLIIDSDYAYDIAKNLVKMGETLFSTGDIATRKTERSLFLEEGEVDDLLQETQQLTVINIETEKTV